jgi:hypothetical protein
VQQANGLAIACQQGFCRARENVRPRRIYPLTRANGHDIYHVSMIGSNPSEGRTQAVICSRLVPERIRSLAEQVGVGAIVGAMPKKRDKMEGQYFSPDLSFGWEALFWRIGGALQQRLTRTRNQGLASIMFAPDSEEPTLTILHELGHHVAWLAGEQRKSCRKLQLLARGLSDGEYISSKFDETCAEALGLYLANMPLPDELRKLAERLLRKAARKYPVLGSLIGHPLYSDEFTRFMPKLVWGPVEKPRKA